ncbi:MAG: hypothetical protein ACXWXQ_07500 [Actinomycetota bacterium]
MDRTQATKPLARAGLLLCCLLTATIAGWAAGWTWLAVPAALGTLGVAAAAVGADSRAPGDWRRTGTL